MIYDVAIVGAGPVGLMLACELGLTGATVLVLDQAADAQSPLKQVPFGMRGLTVPTVEAFHRRGILADIVPADDSQAGPDRLAPRRQAGHFAGIPFDEAHIDASRWPWRLPGPAGRNMAGEMQRIENVLAARAMELGVHLRWGCAVEGHEQTDEGVVIRAGGGLVRARWLVGCDGGRSIVRKSGGFEFTGTDPEFTGYTAMVELADPDKLAPGRNLTRTGMYFQSRPGHLAMAAFDKGAFHRSGPVTLEHLQDVLRHVSGTDVTIRTLHLATSWTDRAQQATAYRRGRVFLAGDAAHIHSPLGGQGLNLGLGDAMNLGWKLGAVIAGNADPRLLDTYQAERHPVGERVLAWSRAQVAIMRPDPLDRAMGELIRDLIGTQDGATYFAGQVWGVSLRYDLGDSHPLVGRSAPDFEFMDGRMLGSLMHSGDGILLDFTGQPDLATIAMKAGHRLHYVAAPVRDALGLTAVFVRPDGIVGWVAEGVPDIDGLTTALATWAMTSTVASERCDGHGSHRE